MNIDQSTSPATAPKSVGLGRLLLGLLLIVVGLVLLLVSACFGIVGFMITIDHSNNAGLYQFVLGAVVGVIISAFILGGGIRMVSRPPSHMEEQQK